MNIGSKSVISLQRGPVDPKFRVEGVALHEPFFFSENYRSLNDLLYGIKILTNRHISSVFSQCTRLTDRRTDGRTDGQNSHH